MAQCGAKPKDMAILEPGVDSPLLDQLTTALVVCDLQGVIHFLNPAAEQLFLIGARQAQGRSVFALLRLPDALYTQILHTVSHRQTMTERHIPVCDANGQTVHIDLSISRVHYHDTPAMLLECNGVDRYLRIAREGELLEQHEVARNVLRGLAHEIKNPLGGVRGAAQLLEAEFSATSAMREYTQVIIAEADRLQHLVNRMLGPSHQMPQWQMLNVHQIGESVLTLLRAQLRAQTARHIHIQRDYDPSIPALYADPDWLLQALLNLGVNALEACTPLDRQCTITLRTRVVHHFTIGNTHHRTVAVLQVIDDGPGVSDTMIDHLFYPLVTGRSGGTGLGLSIAQSLARKHGGLIEVQSQPGHTVFSLFLPLRVKAHTMHAGELKNDA